jgi:glycosyltransferase involved in cell wall biosynthesis
MKIGFISTMDAIPWGGSEVLWAAAAERLLDHGCEVGINFKHWESPSLALKHLEQKGAIIHNRRQPPSRHELRCRAWRSRLRMPPSPTRDQQWLEGARPDFVLVTFGYHLDWIPELEQLQSSGIPWAINLQVASAAATPEDGHWERLRSFYSRACHRYFLCEENRIIMETLLGQSMAPYSIVDNPTKVSFDQEPLPFPASEGDTWSLACVGRLQFSSKGQDLLVEALKRPHWRARSLQIVFYGEDQGNLQQLRKRVEVAGLEAHFQFVGYTGDPLAIWREHHGLVLTSRFEGLPMVTVEAMRAARMAIVTTCGRNPELVDDGVSGFLATGPTVDAVDDALNRAWERRYEWESMGKEAHRKVRLRYSPNPVDDFVSLLQKELGL